MFSLEFVSIYLPSRAAETIARSRWDESIFDNSSFYNGWVENFYIYIYIKHRYAYDISFRDQKASGIPFGEGPIRFVWDLYTLWRAASLVSFFTHLTRFLRESKQHTPAVQAMSPLLYTQKETSFLDKNCES